MLLREDEPPFHAIPLRARFYKLFKNWHALFGIIQAHTIITGKDNDQISSDYHSFCMRGRQLYVKYLPENPDKVVRDLFQGHGEVVGIAALPPSKRGYNRALVTFANENQAESAWRTRNYQTIEGRTVVLIPYNKDTVEALRFHKGRVSLPSFPPTESLADIASILHNRPNFLYVKREWGVENTVVAMFAAQLDEEDLRFLNQIEVNGEPRKVQVHRYCDLDRYRLVEKRGRGLVQQLAFDIEAIPDEDLVEFAAFWSYHVNDFESIAIRDDLCVVECITFVSRAAVMLAARLRRLGLDCSLPIRACCGPWTEVSTSFRNFRATMNTVPHLGFRAQFFQDGLSLPDSPEVFFHAGVSLALRELESKAEPEISCAVKQAIAGCYSKDHVPFELTAFMSYCYRTLFGFSVLPPVDIHKWVEEQLAVTESPDGKKLLNAIKDVATNSKVEDGELNIVEKVSTIVPDALTLLLLLDVVKLLEVPLPKMAGLDEKTQGSVVGYVACTKQLWQFLLNPKWRNDLTDYVLELKLTKEDIGDQWEAVNQMISIPEELVTSAYASSMPVIGFCTHMAMQNPDTFDVVKQHCSQHGLPETFHDVLVAIASSTVSPITDAHLDAFHSIAEHIEFRKIDVSQDTIHEQTIKVEWQEDPEQSETKPAEEAKQSISTNCCGEKNIWELPPDMSLECTCKVHGKNFREQPWCCCYTCGLTKHTGTCIPCAITCHRGHNIVYNKTGRFYCDCFTDFAGCRQRDGAPQEREERAVAKQEAPVKTFHCRATVLQALLAYLVNVNCERESNDVGDGELVEVSPVMKKVRANYKWSSETELCPGRSPLREIIKEHKFKQAVCMDNVILTTRKTQTGVVGWWMDKGKIDTLELETEGGIADLAVSPFEPGYFAAVCYPYLILAYCGDEIVMKRQAIVDPDYHARAVVFVQARIVAVLTESNVQMFDLEASSDAIVVLDGATAPLVNLAYVPELGVVTLAEDGTVYTFDWPVQGPSLASPGHGKLTQLPRTMKPKSTLQYSRESNFLVVTSEQNVSFLRPCDLFTDSEVVSFKTHRPLTFLGALKENPNVHLFSAQNSVEVWTLTNSCTKVFSLRGKGIPFAGNGSIYAIHQGSYQTLQPVATFFRARDNATLSDYEVPITFWIDTDKSNDSCEVSHMGSSIDGLLRRRGVEFAGNHMDKSLNVRCLANDFVIVGFQIRLPEMETGNNKFAIIHGRKYPLKGKVVVLLPLTPSEVRCGAEHQISFETNGEALKIEGIVVHRMHVNELKIPTDGPGSEQNSVAVDWDSTGVGLFHYDDKPEMSFRSKFVSLLDLIARGIERTPTSARIFKTLIKAMYVNPAWADPLRRAIVLSRPADDLAYCWWGEAIEEVVKGAPISSDGWALIWKDLLKLPLEIRNKVNRTIWLEGKACMTCAGVVSAFQME